MRRMRRPRWALAALLLAVAAAGGCTSEQIYNSAQGWRRNECYKLADLEQRDRCLAEANRPFDAYRAARPATP